MIYHCFFILPASVFVGTTNFSNQHNNCYNSHQENWSHIPVSSQEYLKANKAPLIYSSFLILSLHFKYSIVELPKGQLSGAGSELVF